MHEVLGSIPQAGKTDEPKGAGKMARRVKEHASESDSWSLESLCGRRGSPGSCLLTSTFSYAKEEREGRKRGRREADRWMSTVCVAWILPPLNSSKLATSRRGPVAIFLPLSLSLRMQRRV